MSQISPPPDNTQSLSHSVTHTCRKEIFSQEINCTAALVRRTYVLMSDPTRDKKPEARGILLVAIKCKKEGPPVIVIVGDLSWEIDLMRRI